MRPRCHIRYKYLNISDEIEWHMKWSNTEDAEVTGPFPSKQMLQWQDTGYFDKGAYVRKVKDSGGPWYRTDRMDFDLYC